MNKLITLFFFILSFAATAQYKNNSLVFTGFGLEHPGAYTGLSYEHRTGQWAFSAGLDFLHNNLKGYDFKSHAFYKKGYAPNFISHFMPKIGTQYYFNPLAIKLNFFHLLRFFMPNKHW